jgi:hypothetical protein
MIGNVLLFIFGIVLVSAIVELGNGIINQFQTIKYLKSKNIEKFSNFKKNIKSQILDLFEELKKTKFNRDECLQHFPGYFHFENAESKKNKSKLFKITEEVTLESDTYIFPEFSIIFLIE